jgi:O-antigen/teichoic acid export membrane protein
VWLVVLVRRAQPEPGVEARPRGPIAVLARDFWRFTVFRGVSAVFDVAVLWLDVLLVGALGSARQAGIYAAASRLLAVGAFALQAVFLVIGPQISALLAQRSRERALEIYQTSTAWLTAIAFPVYLTMFVFAPLLLRIFGADFTAGATALRILALAGLVNMATGTVTVVLLMGGKSSWNLANNAAALAVNVGLNVLLIPRLGIDGAAIAWAASILVQNLAPLVQVWAALKLHPFGRGYPVAALGAAVCFGGIGGVLVAAFGASAATFTAFALVATGAYAVLLYAVRDVLALGELRAAIRVRRTGRSTSAPRPAVALVSESGRGT